MLTTLVQEYVRKNGLKALEDNFHINIKRHQKYPNLVLLKYNMIDSPMGEPVVAQCRSIILDENKDWEIVAFPFIKFWNYSEGFAAEIDWKTARVYEKLDGSFTQLFFYDNQWDVSSSGLPDAGGNISGGSKYASFAELFWTTWKELGYVLPQDRDITHMFELCTKENRVLVQHEKPRIVFLGARNIRTLQEYVPEPIALSHGWECVRSYPLTSWEEIIEAAKKLDPMIQEGYVVCDANFNRVKMKSPQYVALAHLKDGMSVRRLLEVIRIGEASEVSTILNVFPEWRKEFEEVQEKYELLVKEINEFYATVKDIPIQKDFALASVKKPWSGCLFCLRNGKVATVKEYLSEIQITNLEGYLKLSAKPLYTVASE